MSEEVFTFKTGDTFPNLVATLKANGTKIPDLETAEEIVFIIKNGVTVKEGPCIVKSEPESEVEFDWQPEDTATAGEYQAEFKIHWPDDEIQSVPSATYSAVKFVASL